MTRFPVVRSHRVRNQLLLLAGFVAVSLVCAAFSLWLGGVLP